MTESIVRAYKSADREAVYQICFETGLMGDSIQSQYSDPQSFGDMIVKFFFDKEPENALVAVKDGAIVGYLLGCMDSKNAKGTTEKEIIRIVLRGGLVKPGVARFFWRSIGDLIRDRGAANAEFIDPKHPADFHINLLPQARGTGLGGQLMETWLKRLQDAKVPGVHLATFIENINAHGFFEHYGFRDFGKPVPVPGFRTKEGERMHVQWMVRDVSNEREAT